MNTSQNASLLMTKMLPLEDNQHKKLDFTSESHRDRLDKIVGIKPSADYRSAFDRWKQQLMRLPGEVTAAKFTVINRVVTGIGQENVLESSVAMNRLWGMPIIPGSSLKGLARHYAMTELAGEIDAKQLEILFGSTDDAGFITWHDAWLFPQVVSPFRLDVVTVHHQQYYQKDNVGPTETEDPVPSNFLSVSGDFLIAVACKDAAWGNAALNILEEALKNWGVGAKTNSNYGFMKRLESVPLAKPENPELDLLREVNRCTRLNESVPRSQIQSWMARLNAMPKTGRLYKQAYQGIFYHINRLPKT